MRTADRPFTAATNSFAFAQAFTAPVAERTSREHHLLRRFRSLRAGR